MYFSRSFVLATLPFFTLAIPLVQPHASRGISIPIAKRGDSLSLSNPRKVAQGQRANTIAKIKMGMNAYKKNTGSDHPLSGAIKTSRKRCPGSIPLTDFNNSLWYGTIEVGTPPEAFKVVFDTGSSDLLLPTSDCTSNCEGHTEYNPSSSSTSRDLGKQFKLYYGGSNGSSVNGEIYTDDVTIGGQTACSQTLGAAAQYSSALSSRVFPGLMGMAFQSISEYNAPPVFQALISKYEETEPIFSFKLAPDNSELFLGSSNPGLHKGDFTWVELTTQVCHIPEVVNPGISVNGIPAVEKTEATYDTGTTMIVGDPVGIQVLYAEIVGSLPAPESENGLGLYTIPCEFNTSIVITVGGKPVGISSASFNLGPAPSAGPDRCVAGAAWIKELPKNLWVLGDVFLQNIYTSWDVGNLWPT